MTTEQPTPPAVVLSTAQLKLIGGMEREAFEAWCKRVGHSTSPDYRDKELYWYAETSAAWDAWQARAAMQKPCRGVVHAGCNYLSVCGSVCNKCGQAT